MNKVRDGLLGLAVGDALGVPAEFKSRQELDRNPVTGMHGYGTYHQPEGTWSDDSSLAFCLAESLINGYNLEDMARKFVAWRNNAYWTPHGEVFDIGFTTSSSIDTLEQILEHGESEALQEMKRSGDEHSNGNGALMRILPLYFYLSGTPVEEQFDTVWEVSGLTHGHIRSAVACTIYLIMADEVVNGYGKGEAYRQMQNRAKRLFELQPATEQERHHFHRMLDSDITLLDRIAVFSSGYVVYSLEAALWSLLTSNSYSQTMLKAVNLGEDTDTTAAIAGGLAGLYYGEKNIPKAWKQALVKRNAIEDLADRLHLQYPV